MSEPSSGLVLLLLQLHQPSRNRSQQLVIRFALKRLAALYVFPRHASDPTGECALVTLKQITQLTNCLRIRSEPFLLPLDSIQAIGQHPPS